MMKNNQSSRFFLICLRKKVFSMKVKAIPEISPDKDRQEWQGEDFLLILL